VVITLVERGDEVVLTVDDDGPGIPESNRVRVLQRFVRLDEARSRDDGGSGLGLSIVDEVVRAHGGSMSIEQSPLGGARITVTLPVQAVVS
jgi:signal transduction histidine kinase